MDFNQLVLEALEEPIDYNKLTFILKGTVWMNGATGDITKEKQSDQDREVFCLEDSKGGIWWAERMQTWMRFNETPSDQNFRIIQEPGWYNREKGGLKRGVERIAFRKKLQFDIIPKLVHYHEAGLTPDQASTAIKI